MGNSEFYLNLALILIFPSHYSRLPFLLQEEKYPFDQAHNSLLTLLIALGLVIRFILRSGFVFIIKSPFSHISHSAVPLVILTVPHLSHAICSSHYAVQLRPLNQSRPQFLLQKEERRRREAHLNHLR